MSVGSERGKRWRFYYSSPGKGGGGKGHSVFLVIGKRDGAISGLGLQRRSRCL